MSGDTMLITDAHAHVSPTWYEPVETLLAVMDAHGVGTAVLVQMMGQYDNRYLLDCVRRRPDRFVGVVLVDARRADAPRTLEELVGGGAVGLRLEPATRSPGRDPLAIWRAAGTLGIPVSCLGTVDEFAAPAFADLVAELPDVTIIVEHLGGENTPDEGPSRARTFGLARFPNVYMKLPGASELAPRKEVFDGPDPFSKPHEPLVREAISAFGAGRLMWGSDFPLVMGRQGYGNALLSARGACATLGAEDLASVFGGVARRVFSHPSKRSAP